MAPYRSGDGVPRQRLATKQQPRACAGNVQPASWLGAGCSRALVLQPSMSAAWQCRSLLYPPGICCPVPLLTQGTHQSMIAGAPLAHPSTHQVSAAAAPYGPASSRSSPTAPAPPLGPPACGWLPAAPAPSPGLAASRAPGCGKGGRAAQRQRGHSKLMAQQALAGGRQVDVDSIGKSAQPSPHPPSTQLSCMNRMLCALHFCPLHAYASWSHCNEAGMTGARGTESSCKL